MLLAEVKGNIYQKLSEGQKVSGLVYSIREKYPLLVVSPGTRSAAAGVCLGYCGQSGGENTSKGCGC